MAGFAALTYFPLPEPNFVHWILQTAVFWEAAGLEVLMESLRNYHQLASDGLNLADAAQTPAIREQAEKRQQRQLYESFMRVMALEWGVQPRLLFDS